MGLIQILEWEFANRVGRGLQVFWRVGQSVNGQFPCLIVMMGMN